MSNVAAVTGGIQLNPDDILGHLVFHAVADMKVPKADMANLWAQNNLDPKYLPANIFPSDAFRRATATAGGTGFIEITAPEIDAATKQPVLDTNGQPKMRNYKARLLVREVKNDDHFIVRYLVREVVDDKNVKLYYDHVGGWQFDKKTAQVKAAFIKSKVSEYPYDTIVDNTAKLYDEYINFHTRDTVRNLIVKVVKDSNPTPIQPRSQGKFIPKTYTDRLTGLKGLLEDLSNAYANGGDCSMDIIPIVNTVEQRDMLARKVSFALKDDAEKLIEELARIMKGQQEIKQEVAERLVRNALELKDRTKEYEDLLSVRMGIIDQQLQSFITNVKVIPYAGSQAQSADAS